MRRAICNRVAVLACVAWLAAMFGTGSAQEYRKLQEEGANFYDIQRAFNQYWEGRTPEKGQGWTVFKRWENNMAPRVYPSGILPEPDQEVRAFQQYLQRHGALMKGAATPASIATAIPSANWTPLGPTSVVINAGQNPGIGRISAIAYHPTDANTIFLGTPAGGLWKTTDGGATWSTNTDNLPVLGISGIAIDPANPNIIYIGTGDPDGSDTKSLGVLKSTDGGATWNTTGLNWQVTQSRTMYKLLMHPTNSSILLAATSAGVWKTTDGGVSWSQKFLVGVARVTKDIEFKPGDPATVYASTVSGSGFYKSTNTGDTWVATTTGMPAAGSFNRINIGVTPANANYVYLLASSSANSGFLGFYRSTDSGVSFTTRSTTPNILANDPTGVGGQGSYDLALAISPTHPDSLFAAGVGVYSSGNGGVTWNLRSYWLYSSNPASWVHSDVHLLDFNGSTLYYGTDGGFFKSTNGGVTVTDLTAGMQITQYVKLGSYAGNANLIYAAAQDNGTTRYTGAMANWGKVQGGDGAEVIVDPTNSNIVYVSVVNGSLARSTNGATSSNPSIKNNINETGGWVTPFVMDPVSNTTLYAGYVNVWKTTNSTASPASAVSWTNLSNGSVGTGTFVDLQVAPSNSQYIYGVKSTKVYKTTNAGTTWSDITAGLPTASYTQIAVASNDPNKIWLTMSGYLSGNKVWASTNGGTTWTNYSGTLPNLPFNTIVYHNNGGNDALYAGADVGVYYRDNTMSDWELYQTGLPNVVIRELEVHANSGKLRAATYGRGLWETPLVPAAAPAAALAFDGVDDYVSTSLLSTATTNVTLEGWVNWAGGYGQMFFHNGNTSTSGYGLLIDGNNGEITGLLGGVIGSNSGVMLTVGTWTHLALVGSGTSWSIYKDGVLINSFSGLANTPTDGFAIGAIPETGTANFNGTFDEVRFWNVARTQADIQARMNCELTGTEANLVAYYNFNQGLAGANNAGETTLTDIAGGDNSGTLNNFALTSTTSNWVTPGGVTSGTTCPPFVPPGAALAFDGTDDYVSQTLPSKTSVTIEAWVTFSGSTASQEVLTFSGSTPPTNFSERFYTDASGHFVAYIWDGSVKIVTSTTVAVSNTWYHLALVAEEFGQLKLYVNGVEEGTVASLGDTEDAPILFLGWGPSAFFNGSLDEVRVWNVLRSATDIQNNMSCELSGSPAGLLAYYKCNQGLGGQNNTSLTSLTDASGNANDGAFSNFALTGATSNFVAPGGVTSGTTCTMAALAVNAGNDILRSGGATKLAAFASGGAGDYKYEWAVASGPNTSNTQFSNAAATKTVFTPTAKGNYVLRFTAKDAMNAIATDNVAVTVNTLASASISGDDPVNPGSSHTYAVTTDASNPSYLWIVSNGTIAGDNDQASVEVEAGQPNLPMLVEVYVTDGNTNDVTYAFKSVTINYPFGLTANAGPDRTIIVGGSVTIGGSPAAIGGIAPLTYEWTPATGLSDPNVANPLAQPTATTTYTLTVKDGYEVIATDEMTVTVNALVVKPFVFVGNKVTLKSTKQTTPAGNIHSNGLLTVEKGYPSTYNSNLTAIGKITINKQNTINGNVKSQTSISNSGTITGTKTIGAVNNEPLPSLTYSAGGSNKTVPNGGSLALAPGSYGIVTLNSGGTLKLTSGDYYMNELRNSTTANNSVIEIDLSSGNPVTINIVTNFQFGNEAAIRLLPNGESDSKLVTFNTKQTTAANWGREGYMLGNFNAPNAIVTLVKNSQLRGTICAKELVVSNDCLFLHHDSPGTLPGPGNLPKTAGEVYEVASDQSAVTSYQLEQNYPNPFNPETGIRFALPEASTVSVVIYSLSGQIVKELVNGTYATGRHQVIWNGRDDAGVAVAGGIYFYRLIVQGENGETKFMQTRKMTFVK